MIISQRSTPKAHVSLLGDADADANAKDFSMSRSSGERYSTWLARMRFKG